MTAPLPYPDRVKSGPGADGAARVLAHDQEGAACLANVPIADQAMTLALAARAIRDAMKDKSYRNTPLGVYVARYIRWLRNEYGATEATVRDYEAILARMSLVLADKQVIEIDIEDLRDVIDLWSARAARTRQKVTSVVRAFWAWMEEYGHIAISPAGKIRRPKAEQRIARVLPVDARTRLLHAARAPRDRVGLYCLLGLGIRREELAGVQVRDFDPRRGWLRVYGKGRKERQLPIVGALADELNIYMAMNLPHLDRPPQADDYLIYPAKLVADGKGSEGQMIRRRDPQPKQRCSPQSIHRWWYRIAQDAGLVGHNVTQGLNMHQARHLFAMELRRAAGIDAASQALGHADLSTTLGIYGHRDGDDLKDAMEILEKWRQRAEDEDL